MAHLIDGPRCRSRRLPRAVFWRRRLGLALLVLGLVGALLSARGGVEADLARRDVAGRVTVTPGQTLWDIAVSHAPPGTDPRAYLLRLRQVNSLDGGPVPVWTVVFLPAP